MVLKKDDVIGALVRAADDIGTNNYTRKVYCAVINRTAPIRGVTITEAHYDVVKAISDLYSGRISVENAMEILTRADVRQERRRS